MKLLLRRFEEMREAGLVLHGISFINLETNVTSVVPFGEELMAMFEWPTDEDPTLAMVVGKQEDFEEDEDEDEDLGGGASAEELAAARSAPADGSLAAVTELELDAEVEEPDTVRFWVFKKLFSLLEYAKILTFN